MRILLSFALFTLLQFNLYSQSDTLNVVVTETKFGDYFISNHAYVHGSVLRAKYPESRMFDYSESDSSITIFNSKGKVLYTESFPLDGSSDLSFFADTMSFCGVGTLLAYNFEVNPNYGNCTNSIQFWGYNESGEFVPFTGFISVCYDTKPNIKWVKSKLKINTDGNEYDCPGKKEVLLPYMVVQHETGFFGVAIFDYYKIDLNGLKNTKDYTAEKNVRQPILVNDMQVDTLEYDETMLSTLRLNLYSKPNLSSSKKSIHFKERNSITYHYYTQTQSNFWIRVSINGIDGFMLFDDLEKLGFEMRD